MAFAKIKHADGTESGPYEFDGTDMSSLPPWRAGDTIELYGIGPTEFGPDTWTIGPVEIFKTPEPEPFSE